ncbi:MAG: serine/threonine protein kinase [Actinobacteria bacterium]|nr:serine/threonine protein kinase [Actinomycetota bacterium]
MAGRYRTGDLLGRGGMGEVYDAVDLRLDRPVALKRLRADMADDPSMRRRVEAEARLAAKLTHPNVVTVFDSGLDGGHPFIVMERLGGRTLRDEMAAGPIEPDRVRAMALQVLEALAAAHAIGLIHRDVKPGNILVGPGDTWKVADFGIATSTDSDLTITRTGEVLGSPSYLAPERLDGEAATARSDLYSLGVVLYEAVSGERPFGEGNPWALGMRIRDGSHEPLTEIAPRVEPALAASIERAMSRDPAQRFGSAQEMADALGRDGDATQPVGAAAEDTAPTEMLRRAQDPTLTLERTEDSTAVLPAPSPTARGAAPRRLLTLLVAAALLVVTIAALAALAISRETTTGTPPGPARSAGTSGDPASLQVALDRLQETITP